MKGAARDLIRPPVREGRVSKVLTSSLEVQVRSSMGDRMTLPARGAAPRAVDGGTVIDPARGDIVWVAEDEDGALVVVAWEPA